VLNALLYIVASGCQWRLLPEGFPPYSTVQRFFYTWRQDGTWQRINHALVMRAREAKSRFGLHRIGDADSRRSVLTGWGVVMPAPISRDLRERIVRAVEGGSSIRAAGARFAVSPSAAIKLMARLRGGCCNQSPASRHRLC
jgi:hypothetical protein